LIRTGVIHNPRSHGNRKGSGPRLDHPPEVRVAAPETREALAEALRGFAADGVELLVLEGGDGSVREAVSRLPEIFGPRLPRLAVLPAGKTNALAQDLGVPPDWRLKDVFAAAHSGATRLRRPLEVLREGEAAPQLRGFVFGAGAFVKATALAQGAHRLGAFGDLAVGLTLAGAVGRIAFGGPQDPWRAGEAMRIGEGGAETPRALLLASTLQELPLRMKPFGALREGVKLLVVDAPPRRLLAAAPLLIAGAERGWLERAGYRRSQAEGFALSLAGDFVLDGEIYRGGELTLRAGPALEFVAP
jgi:hypothetical protein